MHWAVSNPQAASKRSLKPAVAREFVAASHGQSLKGLPERVKKSRGGAVRPCSSLSKGW